MTRDEFLNRLGELLSCLPADQIEETKKFYAEAIADRMEDGMREEEAVAALGGAGVVELVFAAGGVVIGHAPYVFASAGVGLGLVGVALLTGAGAWEASKQIARLSVLWARKAVSPFWKDRGRRGDEGAVAHLGE